MKKMKKTLALLLAVLVCFNMMACSAPSAGGSDAKAEASSANSEAKSESTDTADSAPTKLTMYTTEAFIIDPIPWWENDVMKAAMEKANVELDVTVIDRDSYNLMVASGDLPDIVFDNSSGIDDVVNAGLALNMDPYLEEYAPNMLLDCYTARNTLVREMKGGEDKGLYFVAVRIGTECDNGGTSFNQGYTVRWDYYKEIGAPEITDEDSFIEAIDAMVKAHPETEDGKKTYGMAIWDSFDAWYERTNWINNGLNPWVIMDSQYMADCQDGTLVDGYINTEDGSYWKAMRFFNKLYSRGLLDPDTFTMTPDEVTQRYSEGRYVAETDIWSGGGNFDSDAAAKNGESNDVGFMVVPSENMMAFANKHALTGDFPTRYLYINKNSENWEAALRFFNVLHDLDVQRSFLSGFEGEQWEYVDGVPTLTEKGTAQFAENGDEIKTIGAGVPFRCFQMFQDSYLLDDGYPVSLQEMEESRLATLTPIQKDYAKFYGVTYPSEVIMKLVNDGKVADMSKDHSQLVASFMETKPTDVTRIIETCNSILYRAIPDLVMASSEEEFESIEAQILKDVENANEKDAWDWCSNEYNRAKAIVDPLFEEAMK